MNKYIIALIIVCCQLHTGIAQNYKFGKVSKEELLEVEHPSEPEAKAAILYRSFKTTFDYGKESGFTGVIKRKERIKIYTKDDNDWVTVSVYLYRGANNSANEVLSGLKAYTYNYDGDIEKIKLDKKQVYREEVNERYTKVTFTMPNIKNGSVIEYEYSIRTPYLNEFDKFYFQESIPVDVVEINLAAPEYLVYKTHRNGWVPFSIVKSSREGSFQISYKEKSTSKIKQPENRTRTIKYREDVSEVNLKNVPSLKPEPYAGNVNSYRTTLQFELEMTRFPNDAPEYYTTSWDEVASTIYKSSDFGSQLNRQGFFKDEVDQLIAGSSEKEKVIKIYDYVRNSITWNGNYGIFVENGTASTFKNKSGNMADINLLLVSMLKYAGIKADPILLGTKSHGIYLFPTRTGFNAVIAGAEIDGEMVLLDASDKLASPNFLKSQLLNWFGGRMVEEDGTSKAINLKNAKAIHHALANVNLDDEGIAIASVKNRYSNNYAHEMRRSLYGKKEVELNTAISAEFNDAEIEEVDITNLLNAYKPLSVSFDADVTSFFETIGDKIYLNPLFFYGIDENLFKAEERTLPVDFDYSRLDRITINVNIPKGYIVETLPEPLVVSMVDGIASYKYNISNTAASLSISVQRDIDTSLVAVDYYKSLKAFFEMILNKENEKVVLKKA